jgi:hypothetical protein
MQTPVKVAGPQPVPKANQLNPLVTKAAATPKGTNPLNPPTQPLEKSKLIQNNPAGDKMNPGHPLNPTHAKVDVKPTITQQVMNPKGVKPPILKPNEQLAPTSKLVKTNPQKDTTSSQSNGFKESAQNKDKGLLQKTVMREPEVRRNVNEKANDMTKSLELIGTKNDNKKTVGKSDVKENHIKVRQGKDSTPKITQAPVHKNQVNQNKEIRPEIKQTAGNKNEATGVKPVPVLKDSKNSKDKSIPSTTDSSLSRNDKGRVNAKVVGPEVDREQTSVRDKIHVTSEQDSKSNRYRQADQNKQNSPNDPKTQEKSAGSNSKVDKDQSSVRAADGKPTQDSLTKKGEESKDKRPNEPLRKDDNSVNKDPKADKSIASNNRADGTGEQNTKEGDATALGGGRKNTSAGGGSSDNSEGQTSDGDTPSQSDTSDNSIKSGNSSGNSNNVPASGSGGSGGGSNGGNGGSSNGGNGGSGGSGGDSGDGEEKEDEDEESEEEEENDDKEEERKKKGSSKKSKKSKKTSSSDDDDDDDDKESTKSKKKKEKQSDEEDEDEDEKKKNKIKKRSDDDDEHEEEDKAQKSSSNSRDTFANKGNRRTAAQDVRRQQPGSKDDEQAWRLV